MSFLKRTTGVLVDEFILGIRRVFHPAALAEDAGLSLPVFEALAAQQAALPPEPVLPARFERDPSRSIRIPIRHPALETESFAEFQAAARPARLPSGVIVPAEGPLGPHATDSQRMRAAHGAPDTLVIYHHGLSEVPHDVTGRPILSRAAADGCFDWAIVKAPHHETRGIVASRFLASLSTFGRCLLASVFASRALARALKARFGYRHVVFVGMSMGGVVGLLDATIPGSPFELHVPLMAGPDIADVLLRSSFSKILCQKAHRNASASPDLERLDIAARLGASGTPICAIISKHDRLFRIEAQRAAYARVPRARVVEIDAGHVTGAFQFGTLARFVRSTIEREVWEPAQAPREHAPQTPAAPRGTAEMGSPHGAAVALA